MLRSCYSSTWRLFRNSPQLTAGRYYFSPPNTPFYPGLHDVWSAVWVNDELEGAGPYLGEVPPTLRGYFKGALPVAPPPAAALGGADCVANGDSFPPPAGRNFAAGIDCRCWTQQGQACPPAPPWGLYSYGGLLAGGRGLAPVLGAGGQVGYGSSVALVLGGGGLLAGGRGLAPVLGAGGQVGYGSSVALVLGGGGLLAGGAGVAQQLGRGGVLGGGAATILTGGETTACSSCPGGAPLSWTLTVMGFGGPCADLNGTFTLAWFAGCTWWAGGVGGKWQLTNSPSWRLIGNSSSGGAPKFDLAGGSFACLNANTFTLADPSTCPTGPTSLSIAPV
jgi:hypothetical protein